MAISTPGVGSGLDINSIVTQLVAVEKAPLQKLQQRATALQTQISSWGKLNSLMDTLRDQAQKLASSTTWSATQVSSADATTVAAATVSGASPVPGRYSVQVTALAQAHGLASAALPANADLRGHLSIQLGQWSSGSPSSFTAGSGASLELDFTDPATTVSQVRDAINAANAGVRATVIQDGAGSRLVLSSANTGAAQALRITATPTAPTGASPPNDLSALGFQNDGNTSALAQTQAAQNAQYSVNGLALSAASNVLDGVVSGLKLTLQKVSTTPIDITVVNDKDGQRKAVDDFVSAYNAVNSLINTETAYDATTKKAGSLQGDAATLAMRRRLRDLVGQSSSASSTFGRLKDLGIDIKRDGSLSVDSTQMNTALDKPNEVAKLWSAAGTGTEASKGLAVRLRALADELTGNDGPLDTKASSLQTRLKRNQTDQDRVNDRVEATRQRLLKQYQSLDSRMASLNGLSGYISKQF